MKKGEERTKRELAFCPAETRYRDEKRNILRELRGIVIHLAGNVDGNVKIVEHASSTALEASCSEGISQAMKTKAKPP